MRSLPSDLMAKIKQSLQTISNVSQPKLKVVVSRAKTTVTDSNYWTVETIKTKVGLGDISVAPRRFLKHYGGPDRLYEIYVDNGQVSTSLREYPDRFKQGWQPQFNLGDGSAVAIAFDGEWERYKNAWRLQTHEEPWIFWIDSAGTLWGQLWDDVTTKIELALGVSGVKAIRAWKELSGGLNDQGIVVAYIKAGKVYTRAYCNQTTGPQIFENETLLSQFTGLAVRVGLFTTIDYRLGILVEANDGAIHWFITHRTWVGMAIEPSHLVGKLDTSVVVTEIISRSANDSEYLFADISNSANMCIPITPVIIRAYNETDNEFEIILELSHPVYGSIIPSNFEVVDPSNVKFPVSSIEVVGNIVTLVLQNTMATTTGILTVKYLGSTMFSYGDTCKFFYPISNVSFTADITPLEGWLTERLITSVTQSVVVTEVFHTNSYHTEHLEAGVTHSTIVTKVNDNPL